jgi:oxygen-independent coproporphyrinogen III oxidase
VPYRHVYVHVPFCARRCSYCDFAIAVRARTPVDEYVRALEAEITLRVASRASTPLDTLYCGGGTPSRLGVDGVARLMDSLRRTFALADDSEVTLEANPDDITPGVVRAWRAAGVNRVSLGVQSFDPAVLSWMHRTHDVADVRRAAAVLGDEGIENWSLDLIYALPPEVARDWTRDLSEAAALSPPHVSAYGLTIEAGTPLARWRSRGEVSEAEEERYESDFILAHDVLASAGYEHYEVSNFARPGWRARHNSAYWRGVSYLGIGPGAHGFDGAERRWNEREYVAWRERIASGTDPLGGSERLTPAQEELERVYVGLRTMEGTPVLRDDAPIVERWVAAGWGLVDNGRLKLTPMGWLRLDALVTALTEHRSRL